VGTGATAVPLQVGDPLKEWVEAPDLEPYRRIDGRQIVTAAMGTLERYHPTETAREDYLVSYEGERFAESMRYVQAYPTELPVLAGSACDHPDAGSDHRRAAGPRGAAGQRGLPPRAAAPEPTRRS
jgi:hypothetical protein